MPFFLYFNPLPSTCRIYMQQIHFSVFPSLSLSYNTSLLCITQHMCIQILMENKVSRVHMFRSLKQWAEMKDRSDGGWKQTCFVNLCYQVSLKNWLYFFFFFSAFVSALDQYIPHRWKQMYFCYACHSDIAQWKKTYSLCGYSLEVNDWQSRELVATGFSNMALSPSTNYTSHITGSKDRMDAGSPVFLFFIILCMCSADA